MVRVLGIDPGTKSFDLVVVEDGYVVWESSVETRDVAEHPEKLIEAISSAGEVDAIAAPSGYGVPVTFSTDVLDPETFAYRVLLLSEPKEVVEAAKRGEPGMMVYYALARCVSKLCSIVEPPSVFIPGVVHLPTVYSWAKYNKVDLGTADKLAVTVLAVYQLERLGCKPTFLLLEMGYGYNALIYVEEGVVKWGLGGTSFSTGMLTAGPLDLEVVVAGRKWLRQDVFYGGVMPVCNVLDPLDALRKAREDEECRNALNSMINTMSMIIAGASKKFKCSRLIVSGRLTQHPELLKMIHESIPPDISMEVLQPLDGARISKHAAQGYALVVEGLLGGSARHVVSRMRIMDACGTCLDHVYHPRLSKAKRILIQAYRSSVRRPKLCR